LENQEVLDSVVKNLGGEMTMFRVNLKSKGNKDWSRCKNVETWDKYKISKKEIKKVVSEERTQAFDKFYQSLGTKGGGKSIYKLAKRRGRKTRDLDQVKCVTP